MFLLQEIQMGRYDALLGVTLLSAGDGKFNALAPAKTGISLDGETRFLKRIVIDDKVCYLSARNNDSVRFFTLAK
jgi:hypothetical protein